MEFAPEAGDRVIAGVVGREEDVVGPGLVDRCDGVSQILVGDGPPGRHTRTQDHLHLDAGVVTPTTGDREVKPSHDGVDGLLRDAPDHLENHLDGRMPAAGEHDQSLALDSRQ